MRLPFAARHATLVGPVGFFGKLPDRGDFLTRGLPHDFLAFWEAWLGAHPDGRERVADTVPAIVCFVAEAGVCSATGWVGAIAPSRDSVGRSFPMTLAMPMGGARFDAPPPTVSALSARLAAGLRTVCASHPDASPSVDRIAQLNTFCSNVRLQDTQVPAERASLALPRGRSRQRVWWWPADDFAALAMSRGMPPAARLLGCRHNQ